MTAELGVGPAPAVGTPAIEAVDVTRTYHLEGVDIDALRVVASGVNSLRGADRAIPGGAAGHQRRGQGR